jgi:hypothetical protein
VVDVSEAGVLEDQLIWGVLFAEEIKIDFNRSHSSVNVEDSEGGLGLIGLEYPDSF